jgi:hypothetical protein
MVSGKGIAKHFMVPYNKKLLGASLCELRPEYAERFIPQPPTEDVIKGALGRSANRPVRTRSSLIRAKVASAR